MQNRPQQKELLLLELELQNQPQQVNPTSVVKVDKKDVPDVGGICKYGRESQSDKEKS